jgi:hypothetical protein
LRWGARSSSGDRPVQAEGTFDRIRIRSCLKPAPHYLI